MNGLGVASYGAAALSYGVVAILVIASRPGSGRAFLLAGALLVSSVWAGSLILLADRSALFAIGLDAAHLFAWTLCVLSWLSPPSAGKWLLGASAATGLIAIVTAWSADPLGPLDDLTYLSLVLMALIGFLAVEQVYRNAQEGSRQQLRNLCLAAGGIVAIDLFVYAHAVLLRSPDSFFWQARGFANIAFLPLIVLGAKSQADWKKEPFVSRHVVFYAASALGVGLYLLAMGLVAYVIRALGGQWSLPLDLAFLVVGIGVLFSVVFSDAIRRRFKVFLVKHFYRTKYDYREAWLRLTQSLSRTGDLQQAAVSALEGMARIIGSQSGNLWLERDGQRHEWLVSLGNGAPPTPYFDRGHPLIAFLSSSGWVIDSEEYAQEPDRYGTAFGHPDDGLLPKNSLIIPLDQQGHLQGFVILAKPPGLRSLNFEDHDILKTAGRQVAAVLAQALVQEKLAETRQFEALNRLSAFLMHDLKNIVAQQELVVANAQRFRHRPEFIDDAFATIRGGTERIKKVLEQLGAASRTRPPPSRVDLSKLLMEVRSQCADRQPIPSIDVNAQACWVRIDRDDLASALVHLVRNAQDATPADGRIDIALGRGPSEVVVSISDTGRGMDAEFIRSRLFRPFDSTKGAQGMGIGAYQARHIVRLAGGDLEVTSEVGVGTTFRLRLPIAE